MYYSYASELEYWGNDEKDGGMVETLSLTELLEKRSKLEYQLKCLREKEPSRKRKNKQDYVVWVRQTHNLLEEIKRTKEEIVRMQKNDGLV